MAKTKTIMKRDICCSDAFLDLSHSAQALYLQLNLNADSQGVVCNVRSVLRGGLFEEEHLTELIEGGYVLELEHERLRLLVVSHWWHMNTIDRRNFLIANIKSACVLRFALSIAGVFTS